jgi:hypothetical protein
MLDAFQSPHAAPRDEGVDGASLDEHGLAAESAAAPREETPRKTRARLRLRLRSAHQRTSGAPRLEDFDAVARHCWTMAQRVGGRRRGWKAAIAYWYPFLGFNFTNYSPAPPRGFFYVGARPMIGATEAA